ncbi:hypothetical protein [Acinetobacter indicus]|uniref:Uncharacterized protein n=1 Tax=Acinetobacter indicus TaxID=756892 RepID=A0AAW8Z233_9GAMM|nr:hypothetical protein [Acinetobacter indicus]MDV4314351.1 hypothetical protein [Acinetobacter indicus]
MADKVISLWGGLRHLRQKAVQVIFALVDIVMEHKCPIKAEVIYDKKNKQPLMVAGANPPRHKFMETPGSGRFGADIIVVKNIMKAPTLDNILHWVEIKFIDSKDDPDREQMDDYTDFLNGSSKLTMIRVSADPKKVIVVVRQRQYRRIRKSQVAPHKGKRPVKLIKCVKFGM